jgi:lysophospholipase L1-like esterase
MKPKTLLITSLGLNILSLILFVTLAVVFRDKLIQRFITWKGNASIVMFGDSITAQGKWAELLGRTDVVNSGFPGLCTWHFLGMLQSQIIDIQPEICFVMGGINDITVGVAPEKILEHYQAILETISKNKIIPVVTLTVYEQNDPMSKKSVVRLNELLIKYCTDNKIEYMDINPYISDSTGLNPLYAVDRTHLNGKAYKIWAAEINKVLKRHGI